MKALIKRLAKASSQYDYLYPMELRFWSLYAKENKSTSQELEALIERYSKRKKESFIDIPNS